MKNKIKTVISLLLTAALLQFLLLSCKKADGTGTQETDESTVTTAGEQTAPVDECETHSPSAGGGYCTVCNKILKKNKREYHDMIYFSCDDETLTRAYTVAVNDVCSNIKPYKNGLLAESAGCIMAGADYDTPWTRDTAINVWNAFALLDRQTSKNTMLSVLKRTGNKVYIDGQYWDAVIWAIGAYQYILTTNDTIFLKTACEAVRNSLAKYENDEFDAADGLFRGAAVYGDGIAAYPDKYTNGGTYGIESWATAAVNKALRAKKGVGITMKALSTNCVYYEAYVVCAKMCDMLSMPSDEYTKKADALKNAINKTFWNEKKGTYDYLAYECDYQEALGIAYALLFGVADERKAALVLENAQITENGIACVYPSFERYLVLDGYGRHSGTIWPHAQGFYARAAFENGYTYGFENELFLLAEKAVRDGQFYEIYHPDTGAVYGGLQGSGKNDIFEWGSCSHQTWSATAYLSLVYYNILGADIGDKTVTFKPYLPTGVNEAVISGFKVGNTEFDIIITREGENPSAATFDTDKEQKITVLLSV